MAVRFYVFHMSNDLFEADLSAIGMVPADLNPPSGIAPAGPSNNPFQGRDRDGNPIVVPPAPGLGYGWSFTIDNPTDAKGFLDDFRQKASAAGRSDVARILGIDFAAAPLELAARGQHWCAGRGAGFDFGTRRNVRRLISADALRDRGLTGEGVNVVLVDQGVSKDYIESLGANYGGGLAWPVDGKWKEPGVGEVPNVPLPDRHASMLMRSLADLAPEAVFYDLPLLPERITDVENFTLHTLFAFAFLDYLYLSGPGRWVVLNAWGIVDRFAESLRGYYTDDPDHYLNIYLSWLGGNHDFVFAAGNSGQFCGDPRSTGYDRGPGRSIWGANALRNVTCVGAVRADGTWVGASSQGPGPAGYDLGDGPPRKPDICAPGWFLENGDAHLRSSGTSAASAVVAGAVAALRAGWAVNAVSPASMRTALRAGARKVSGPGWNGRTGYGALDLPGTIAQLPP